MALMSPLPSPDHPTKVYVGQLFAFFPRKVAAQNVSKAPPTGLGAGKKGYVENLLPKSTTENSIQRFQALGLLPVLTGIRPKVLHGMINEDLPEKEEIAENRTVYRP